jgi:phosphoserine phosphatase RsbU/P
VSILIVDDSLEHRILMESILHQAGYRNTTTAESAHAAYQQLHLGSVGSSPLLSVNVILMDIMMPHIDGLEACRAIKGDRRLADIPIIMVTAMTDAEHLRHAFAAGATDYIRKPILPVELIARICTVLTLQAEMAMRKRREQELGRAMGELKALRGCAPMCMGCKRIRGPLGRWQSLEAFIKAYADLRVDDTLCHACVQEWKAEQAR